jgi:hypothetical protein
VGDRDDAAARAIEGVGGKAEDDRAEAVADAGDDTPTGTGAGGVEGEVTALEGADWLTTVAVASPTGLAWLATAVPAPLRRPPTGVAATAGVVQATVPTSPASIARDANALKERSALPSIGGFNDFLVL